MEETLAIVDTVPLKIDVDASDQKAYTEKVSTRHYTSDEGYVLL